MRRLACLVLLCAPLWCGAQVVNASGPTAPARFQSFAGLTLEPLRDEDLKDRAGRVAPSCRAVVVDAVTERPVLVVEDARWVRMRTSRGLYETPIIQHEPEVEFSATDHASLGGSLSGTLARTGASQRCESSVSCREFSARLTMTFIAVQSYDEGTLFEGDVKVVDSCGTSTHRLFKTTPVWVRALFSLTR